MNKRDFLKLSSAAFASSLLASAAKASAAESGLSFFAKKPITRTLGKTGIKVPIISSGELPLDNIPLMREIFKSGIRHIDSAWMYKNGRNDTTLGQLLKEFGRDNFITSSKVKFDIDKVTGQYKKEATTRAFLDQLDESLKRQGSDHVDILYLHAVSTKAAALNEEMLNGLRKAKEMGKALSVGITAHNNQVEVIDAALESKLYEVILPGYNFRNDSIVRPAIARATAAGIGIVVMKVFAGEFEDKTRNKPINKSAALKWVLNDENVHTVILTIRTFEDLELYKTMMTDIKINNQELKDLQASAMSTGLYCLGCEKCFPQCRKHLPVSDLMRAYMYAYGYRNLPKAHELVSRFSLSENICDDCLSCSVKCTKGFDVKEKISDIARLKNVPGEFMV